MVVCHGSPRGRSGISNATARLFGAFDILGLGNSLKIDEMVVRLVVVDVVDH
jgi:hypothetical protein